MVAQTSQVSKRALLSLLISPCCATTWHVDPWHICVVLNSWVPRIFVPQMLPLSVCLRLPCFFWNMALRNIFGSLDGNGCADFPSQQRSFVKLADISMLCNNMTRWPLTHLCSPKQLCPKNLCATKMFFYVRCWNLFENCSRTCQLEMCFQRGIHTCTRCPNAAELRWACWNFHAVPEYVTHLALTRLCVLSRGVPRSFVLQVLEMQYDMSSPAWQNHMLNLQICTVSQVNRVVLSSLLTRHAVLEDRHVDPDTGPESGLPSGCPFGHVPWEPDMGTSG